jgi:L-rhamnose mutarotase
MSYKLINVLIISVLMISCVPVEEEKENTVISENKTNGYLQKDFDVPVKRYCQVLTLRDDPVLIEEYKDYHADVWPEVLEGIKEIGILDHEIYIHGNTVFMILVTPADFDFDTRMSKLAGMSRQAEWEELMTKFQVADPTASSAEKWQRMERIFKLK